MKDLPEGAEARSYFSGSCLVALLLGALFWVVVGRLVWRYWPW